MRTVLGVVTVILAFAATASAQEGRWKAGGNGECYWDATDSGPQQCVPPEAAPIQAAFVSAMVEAQEVGCDEVPEEDPEGKWACNKLVEGIAGATLAMSGGTNIYADAVTCYCLAADIVYGAKDAIDRYYTWAAAEQQRIQQAAQLWEIVVVNQYVIIPELMRILR